MPSDYDTLVGIMLKKLLLILLFVFFLFPSTQISIAEFPAYRVIIDPGHGGFSLLPKSRHGDRYDSLSNRYLSNYLAGTSYGKVEERIITYEIAEKVKNILDFTSEDGKFEDFLKILSKYTDKNPSRVVLLTRLSRENSTSVRDAAEDDPNADFRLFNFIDNNGKERPGRISVINSYKPHLVVTLHCDYQAPVYYRGINPVIAAPYTILYQGMEYLKGNIKDRNFYFKSRYADWFTESNGRTGFKWFLKDVSVYFTGFPIGNNLLNGEKFLGYTYNMISWNYRDVEGWEKMARGHSKNAQYAKNAIDFIPQGKFWEREQSVFESYRREFGNEGFGGDNHYASSEIIRYILLSLNQSNSSLKDLKLGKPYISVWSLPILVNAISAYIELGYLKNKRDRYYLTKKQDEIAEGIAAGIYSLMAGLELRDIKHKNLPRGKKLDLDKYKLPSGNSYFDIVAP
jgi:hypothetical protein